MDLNGSVTIAEPDPGWPQSWARHRELLIQILGPQLVQMHHVGSTALHGVAARPIIDVLIEVISLDSVISLESVWKKHKFEFTPTTWGIHHGLFLRKAPFEPIHIHILEKGDPQVHQWLELQRYLKAHPQVCALYSRMKKTAALESGGNLLRYELTKQRFLQQAFVKSCSLWHAPESLAKGLDRFMSIETVAKRAWDTFCLFHQTLFRYSPLCQPIPYPGLLAWQSRLKAPCFSPLWRFTLPKDDLSTAFLFLLKHFESSPCSRLAWVSPFDPITLIESRLSDLGFTLNDPLHFLLLPLFKFQVYDKSPRTFKRVLHSQELYDWLAHLRSQTQTSEWYELYTSLPSQLYAYGQNLEFYCLQEGDKTVGSCLLFYHLESVFIVEMRWQKEEHLKDMVNMVVQRAHALNYPYVLSYMDTQRLASLKKLGFASLFELKQWQLLHQESFF
jgi:GrpB-like predicted nucleotidyltransferase (UPF0157 family)